MRGLPSHTSCHVSAESGVVQLSVTLSMARSGLGTHAPQRAASSCFAHGDLKSSKLNWVLGNVPSSNVTHVGPRCPLRFRLNLAQTLIAWPPCNFPALFIFSSFPLSPQYVPGTSWPQPGCRRLPLYGSYTHPDSCGIFPGHLLS